MFSSYQVTASFLLAIVYEVQLVQLQPLLFLMAHQTALSLFLFIANVKTCPVTFCFQLEASREAGAAALRNVAQRLFENYQTQSEEARKKHEDNRHLLQVPSLHSDELTHELFKFPFWGGVRCETSKSHMTCQALGRVGCLTPVPSCPTPAQLSDRMWQSCSVATLARALQGTGRREAMPSAQKSGLAMMLAGGFSSGSAFD